MIDKITPVGQPEMLGKGECHASTLLILPPKTYLCAWFAGTKEGNPDTAIWLSQQQGEIWTEPEIVAKVTQEPHWNPVLFADGGKIYLFFKVGASPISWRTYWMQRPIESAIWSQPQELVPGDVGGRGPVKNKPIKLDDGNWLAPASLETKIAWDCFVDISRDCGVNWQKSALISLNRRNFNGLGIIQPTLWESHPGKVHLLCRTTTGKIYRSDSKDGGLTWSAAYPTSLPNNNSGIDLIRLGEGMLVLAYNPSSRGRTPLTLAASRNNGSSWREICVLENEPGEYSYPAIVATASGFAVSYTWRRQHICFREFHLTF